MISELSSSTASRMEKIQEVVPRRMAVALTTTWTLCLRHISGFGYLFRSAFESACRRAMLSDVTHVPRYPFAMSLGASAEGEGASSGYWKKPAIEEAKSSALNLVKRVGR